MLRLIRIHVHRSRRKVCAAGARLLTARSILHMGKLFLSRSFPLLNTTSSGTTNQATPRSILIAFLANAFPPSFPHSPALNSYLAFLVLLSGPSPPLSASLVDCAEAATRLEKEGRGERGEGGGEGTTPLSDYHTCTTTLYLLYLPPTERV